MSKSVTLSDIGKQLGVSTVTVSKALSGQSGVSDSLRTSIIELADQLGYTPNVKKKKNLGKEYTIGVVTSKQYIGKNDSFYLKMYQVINEKALESNCIAVLLTIDQTLKDDEDIPKIIREGQLDGLIFAGPLPENTIKKITSICTVPRVYLDFCDKQNKEDAIISDSYYGAYLVTDYLIKKGHKDIAFVGTILSTPSITDRYLGYIRALLENGITPDVNWKIDDRYMDSGEVDSTNLIKLPDKMPTAFFCNCDLTAALLIKKLNENGYKVPEDISVVGYDNFIYPGLCDVKITSYEVDLKKMAQLAWKNIIKKLSSPLYHNGIHIVEGRLIEKDSVLRLK